MSDTKSLNLFQKINLVMQKVEGVEKGARVEINSNRSYTAVSHDDVTALLHKPITEAGLVAIPSMESSELELIQGEKEYQGKITKTNSYLVKVWASVTFVNIDKPDERIVTKCYSYALDSGDKATGKAYSMAVKYCYLKTFMLESYDEEESRDYENSHKREYGDGQRNYSNPPALQDNTPPTDNQRPGSGLSSASEAQLNALRKMGVPFKPGISKNEASELIKNANANKRK